MSPSSPISPRTVWVVGLNVLAIAAFGWLLYSLRELLALLAVSLLIALAVEPMVRWLERRHVPRVLGVFLIALFGLAMMGLLVTTLVPAVSAQVTALRRSFPELVGRLRQLHWLRLPASFSGAELPLIDVSHYSELLGAIGAAGFAVTATVAVLTVAAFSLLFGGDLYISLLRLVRPRHRRRADRLVRRMRDAVSGYVFGTVVMTVIGAVVTVVILVALGVPFFLPIGLFMLLLGFIPLIGSFIGAVLVALTTLAAGGFNKALLALVLFLVYQQIASHVLSPLVQGRAVRMNPLLMILVLLAGATAGGLIGGVLAIPVAAALQEGLRELQHHARIRRRNLETRLPPPTPLPPPTH
jgi:predicted PurR-regulated permease PerM